MITPMEKAAAANLPDKRCNFIASGKTSATKSSVVSEVNVFYDELGYFAEQHNVGFNPDNYRYVPGDTVCIYDEVSGAFNVYECPPAPAGNWCCTVDVANVLSSSLTK